MPGAGGFVSYGDYFGANEQAAGDTAKKAQNQARVQAEAARRQQQAQLDKFQYTTQGAGFDLSKGAKKMVINTNVGAGAEQGMGSTNVGAGSAPVSAGMTQFEQQFGGVPAAPSMKPLAGKNQSSMNAPNVEMARGGAGQGTAPTGTNAPGIVDPLTGVADNGLNTNPFLAAQKAAEAAKALEDAKKAPGTLGEMGGMDSVYAQTQKASELMGNLGSESGLEANLGLSGGSGKLSAGLVRGAGKGQFEDLQKQFDPEAEMKTAEDKAKAAHDRAVLHAQYGADYMKDQSDVANTNQALSQQEADRKAAADKAAADEATRNAPGPSFSDMTQNDGQKDGDPHWMDYGTAGRRTVTNNASALATWQADHPSGGMGADAYRLAAKIMEQELGLSSDAPEGKDNQVQAKYWEQFIDSLPSGMKWYVLGMLANHDMVASALGGKGYYGDGTFGGMAPPNSNADWQWFQQLFRAYAKANPPGANGVNADGTQTKSSTGMTSESTKGK